MRWMMVAIFLIAFVAAGCSAFRQDIEVARVRPPGKRRYNKPPVKVSEIAGDLWEYAVLSLNVYQSDWIRVAKDRADQPAIGFIAPAEVVQSGLKPCAATEGRLPLPGWSRWEDFPSAGVRTEAAEVGLYLEVWEKASPGTTVVVAFRGTDFKSWLDWLSNARWFRLARFLPLYRDQYTVISKKVAQEVLDRLAARPGALADPDLEITATGHSLGGGLAQYFAYALPAKSSDGQPAPRVRKVRAFDPSPVTGWSSVRNHVLRKQNAAALFTDRVFEHGEILAYIRLVQSYLVPPSSKEPAIQETRVNFIVSPNIVGNHSMRVMACGLTNAAKANRVL